MLVNSSTSRQPSLFDLMDYTTQCTPLELQEVEILYAATDWRFIVFESRSESTYRPFLAVTMLKALSLPFLINIVSDRALVKELEEREQLRVLCGFMYGRTPSRAKLWHFQRAPLFPDLMLLVLTAIALSGHRLDLNLPFVIPVPVNFGKPQGEYIRFRTDVHYPEIEVWTTMPQVRKQKIESVGETWAQLHQILRTKDLAMSRRGSSGELPLPVEVRTRLFGGGTVHLAIDKPYWMKSRSAQRTHGEKIQASTNLSSTIPYTACNIIVLRHSEGCLQVLLGRRKAGYGRGQYALPGGKVRTAESLEICAKRELQEETGLRIVISHPISIRRTRMPGHPPVFSVGVVVPTFVGEPRNREPRESEQWEWFDIDRLPTPMFEPAQMALIDFQEGKFPDLQWSDVETQLYEKPLGVAQLRLCL